MKFNFGDKLYFSYLLVPGLREERENRWIPKIERKSLG
jgi:hypothetical protein